MRDLLLLAFGFMFVFEGLFPFISPKSWRETFKRLIELKDGQLRFMGLISLVAGMVLIYLSKQ